MTDTTPRQPETNRHLETNRRPETNRHPEPNRHPETSRATDTTGVGRRLGPAGRERDPESLLRRGEAALTETGRAATFRARGDLRALRRLAERSEDPAVRERATTVVRAFDRLRRAVWETPRAGTPND